MNNYDPDPTATFNHKFATVRPFTGEPIEPGATVARLSDFVYARKHLGDSQILAAARHFLEACVQLR